MRSSLTGVELDALADAAKHALKALPWLPVLELFAPLGVVDRSQLQSIANLPAEELDLVLATLLDYRPSQELEEWRIIEEVEVAGTPTGKRGRAPAIYKLGPLGAALLRREGYPDAQPCGLDDPKDVVHALRTLDIRLRALADGLEVRSEKVAEFEGGHVRPDNQVLLATGRIQIIETEQDCGINRLDRVVEKVRGLAALFDSPQAAGYSRDVLVVFSLNRKQWPRTRRVWQRAVAMVANERGGSLAFDLRARLFADLQEDPDWTNAQKGELLTDAFVMAQSQRPHSRGKSAPKVAGGGDCALALPAPALPAELQPRSPTARDDALILAAYWQFYQETVQPHVPATDDAFVDLIWIIAMASRQAGLSARQKASIPVASLYLLRKYFDKHPELRKAINRTLGRGVGSMKWSPATIVDRLKKVVRVFLKYHGLTPDGPLEVRVHMPNAIYGPEEYHVTVALHDPALFWEDDPTIIVSPRDMAEFEAALACVLELIFRYPYELGLKLAPYL